MIPSHGAGRGAGAGAGTGARASEGTCADVGGGSGVSVKSSVHIVEPREWLHDVAVVPHVWIPMPDGVRLSAKLYVPMTRKESATGTVDTSHVQFVSTPPTAGYVQVLWCA